MSYVDKLMYLIVSNIYVFFFLMILRPPRSTRTDTLFPYTTLFRSSAQSYSLPLTAANLCNRAIELMLIMLPRPRGAMRRATAWPTRQTPVRLVSRTCAQSCSVISRKGAVAATTALLPRIWIGPRRTDERRVGKGCGIRLRFVGGELHVKK